MTKSELRIEALKRRKSLSLDDYDFFCEGLEARFKNLNGFNEGSKWAIFLSIEKNKEPRMTQIFDFMWQKGVNTYAPKTSKGGQMEMLPFHSDTELEMHIWGIPEPKAGSPINPEELTGVLVPLLWCNTQGDRIGYGKGFYDRYLSRCLPSVRTIGISLFEPDNQVPDDLEPTDFSIQEILTPRQHIVLNSMLL